MKFVRMKAGLKAHPLMCSWHITEIDKTTLSETKIFRKKVIKLNNTLFGL